LKPGQAHPAIKEIERMLNVTDNIPEVKLTLLGYLVEAGKMEEAKIHASSLLEYDAKNEKLQFYLAKIAHNEGDYPRAIQHYNASIDLSVEPHLAQQLMAECYFHIEDHTKAYELFTAAIKLYSDQNPKLLHYYLFAFSSYIVGDSTKAKRALAMYRILDDDSDPELSKRADELMKILEDG